MKMIFRFFTLTLTGLYLLFTAGLCAGAIPGIEDGELVIFHDPPLKGMAEETARLFPDLKKQLENIFGWRFDSKASIVLVKEREHFLKVAESPLTTAFAVPSKNLIVIDCSRAATNPLGLEQTLKHEMCHLLLHGKIKEEKLPRWLDEGTCQWVSSGFIDIMIGQKSSSLNRAALSDSLIPLILIERRFPNRQESLILAYEQSKSVVNHIVSRFGTEGLLAILNYLKEGDDIQSAVSKALSVSLTDLEKGWAESIGENISWFVQISYHIYEILFGFAALIMVFASIKLIIKKKSYMAMNPDEDGRDDRPH
jgi:hypothetical protein